MAVISTPRVRGYLEIGLNGESSAEKGKALEDLICYVMGKVPGISITHRNETDVFNSEEIDVALWNEKRQNGLFFLPHIILVECKNWSERVGSEHVAWFDTKLRNRGLSFGILVAANGITGNAESLTASHQVISNALSEQRQLVVLSNLELMDLTNSGQIVQLMKKKLCELAVRGTTM